MDFKEARLATGKTITCHKCRNVATWLGNVGDQGVTPEKSPEQPAGASWTGRGYKRESKGVPMANHNNNSYNYIKLGDLAHKELGMTCQYAAYFVDGLAGHPNLCVGLRVFNPMPGCYHTIEIHKDDAPILKERVEKWRKGEG
jgi:hypothetical protein